MTAQQLASILDDAEGEAPHANGKAGGGGESTAGAEGGVSQEQLYGARPRGFICCLGGLIMGVDVHRCPVVGMQLCMPP